MSSLVDYQASYNLDPSNSRSIQAVSALPGQFRQGRHGAASSRFFSRRSLLGSSASGVAPAGLTQQSDVPPLSLSNYGRAGIQRRGGPPHMPRAPHQSQPRHPASPAPLTTPAPARTRYRSNDPQSSHEGSSRGQLPQLANPYLPIPLTSLPGQISHTHKIDKWMAGIPTAAWEPPPSRDDDRTVSSVSTRNRPSAGARSSQGRTVHADHEQAGQSSTQPFVSKRATMVTDDTATSFFPDLPGDIEAVEEESEQYQYPGTFDYGRPEPSSRLSTIAESPRMQRRSEQHPARASMIQPSIRLQPPSTPTPTSPSTLSQQPYLEPPASAKPSIASLPRLSSSAQASFGTGLKGFLSDDGISSVRSGQVEDRNKGKQREMPIRSPVPASRPDLQTRVTDVESESQASTAMDYGKPVPVIMTKHRYGNPSAQMEDRLPFEPPRPAPTPAPPTAKSQFPFPEVQPTTRHTNAAASPGTWLDDLPNHRDMSRRATEGANKRIARELAEAQHEFATIISDKSHSARQQAAYPRSPEGDRHTDSSSVSGDESDPQRKARRLEKEQRRAKRAALKKLKYVTEYENNGLPRPAFPERGSRGLSSVLEIDGGAARRTMQYKKPPTPFQRPGEATSEDETDATVRQTWKVKDPPIEEKKEKKKRSRKREPEQVHGILKKGTSPYPGAWETPSHMGTGETRKVSFGEATPADAGPIHEPVPHNVGYVDESQTATASTSSTSTASPRLDPYRNEPVVRSREPSPDPAELEASRRKRRSRTKDRPAEGMDLNLADEPMPFDFSKLPGPSVALGNKGKQTTVADGDDDEEDDEVFTGPGLDFTKLSDGKKSALLDIKQHVKSPGKVAQQPPTGTIKRNDLDLPTIPKLDKDYSKLPALFLANGVVACKGTSVYRRLRGMIWDYHADLEDVNKRRHKYWLPLAEACEGLVMKMRNSLEDQSCKRKMHIFMKILGTDTDPEENTIIFGRRAVTEQIRQVLQYTKDAIHEFNDIAHHSDEIFDVAGQTEDVPENVRRGFLGAFTGLQYMEVFFYHLFNEIEEITKAIRKIFKILVHVPSPDEMADFPDEKIQFYSGAKDDLIEWMDLMLSSIRGWKGKVTYQSFERQLNPLRNLDRTWAEADDVQFGLLKSLFCFGFCLPRSTRDALNEQAEAQEGEKPATAKEQPRAGPKMQISYRNGQGGGRPPVHLANTIREARPPSKHAAVEQYAGAENPEPQAPAFLVNNPAYNWESLTTQQKLDLVHELQAAQRSYQ